jgi:hypothetical protein
VSIDLRDGFAPTRAEVVEYGRLPDPAAILALGRRRRRHRRIQLSLATFALVFLAGVAGVYVVPWSAASAPLGPGSVVRAAEVPLGKQLTLFQVAPVSMQITYALAVAGRGGDQREWVLGVTADGGRRWKGYQVPLTARAVDVQLVVLTPTVVRVSEPAGHAVISHDSGVTWTGAAASVGAAPMRYPPSWALTQLAGTAGLSMVDPVGGGAYPLHTSGPAVQVGGYQAVSAADGSLWGFGPYGRSTGGNPSTVWVSRDDGLSWRAWAPRPTVPQRAGGGVTTRDGTSGYLFVEASEEPGDGSKVYVTHDHGLHWTYTASTTVVLTQPQLLADNRTLIAVHPGDQAQGELYRSTDGGKTFLQVQAGTAMARLTTTVTGGYVLADVAGAMAMASFSADGLSWTGAPVPAVG